MSGQPASIISPTGDVAPLPVHVAIIMDGNRRWARARGRPPIFGHQQGANAVRAVLETARDLGIRYVTLYAFSAENWSRPASEIRDLMNLLRLYLRREMETIAKHNAQLRFVGDLSVFDADIRGLLAEARAATAGNTGTLVTLAINYGSRQAIAEVASRFAAAAARGDIAPEEITAARFGSALNGDIPDPDLLIRTSGEQRLSNFLLWELAYTELVFSPVPWPDFNDERFREALAEFARRERRYGASGG